MFYRSLAPWEKEHLVDAYSFELGKCTYKHIKEPMLWMIAQIDTKLAEKVSSNIGIDIPDTIEQPINQDIGVDSDVEKY